MAFDNLTDKSIVFNKLKAKSENKVCIDCSAKNPTWASVEYGIFLCVACSVTHLVHMNVVRSTISESWSPEQLRALIFGGNKRAQVFFKQHGWTNDGGKFEAKYTSGAADLYRQILAKEVAEGTAAGPPSSPVATSQLPVASKESSYVKHEATSAACSPKASNTFNKPISGKRTVKTGGLGARKLTTKVKNGLWSLVSKADKMKEKVVEVVLGVDVYGLRWEVTELMQKLHSQDANDIPLATRKAWVLRASKDIYSASYHLRGNRIYRPILDSAREDVFTLMEELVALAGADDLVPIKAD